MLHDPLAAAAALDPGAFRWAEVEVYRSQGRWGANPCAGSGTYISVGVDAGRALLALTVDVPDHPLHP